jgi:hypothetical protein
MKTLIPARRQALQFAKMPGVLMRAADPEGEIAMHASSPATLSASSASPVVSGLVLGMSKTPTTPPRTAPRDPIQIFLMRRAGLAEMHLRVDDARQECRPRQSIAPRRAREIADLGDLAGANADVARALAVLIDERAAGEDDVENLRHEWRLACDVVAGWSFVANAPKARETQAAGGGGGRET